LEKATQKTRGMVGKNTEGLMKKMREKSMGPGLKGSDGEKMRLSLPLPEDEWKCKANTGKENVVKWGKGWY